MTVLNAQQRALLTLAASLPLTPSQRSDVQGHDLPLLAAEPARAVFAVSFGGTHLLRHSDELSRALVRDYARSGAQFWLLDGPRLTPVTPGDAVRQVDALPGRARLTRAAPHHRLHGPRLRFAQLPTFELHFEDSAGAQALTLTPGHTQYPRAELLYAAQDALNAGLQARHDPPATRAQVARHQVALRAFWQALCPSPAGGQRGEA